MEQIIYCDNQTGPEISVGNILDAVQKLGYIKLVDENAPLAIKKKTLRIHLTLFFPLTDTPVTYKLHFIQTHYG